MTYFSEKINGKPWPRIVLHSSEHPVYNLQSAGQFGNKVIDSKRLFNLTIFL